MNRREFLKISGIGAMTLFMSGCGARSLVEKSEFAAMAYKIGTNL